MYSIRDYHCHVGGWLLTRKLLQNRWYNEHLTVVLGNTVNRVKVVSLKLIKFVNIAMWLQQRCCQHVTQESKHFVGEDAYGSIAVGCSGP